MKKNINKEARLTPLTGEEYEAVAAWQRVNDSALCPCCGEATSQGWLDDCGCCYDCVRIIDRPDRPARPEVAELDIRLVQGKNGTFILGVL